jgi:3-phosphoshikimate 1-carboxyvinyltransferase
MSLLRVYPSTVSGSVRAPPSKSYTHRALVVASLCKGPVVVKNPLVSDDTKATIDAIRAFGSSVEVKGQGSMVIRGGLKRPGTIIDAMNSGTTLRLMAGIAGLVDGTTTLTGDGSLRKRPMAPLLSAMESIGARTRSSNGFPPVEVRGRMTGGSASIRGDVSSQFISSLMIAGSQTEKGVEVEIEGSVVSRPYLDITSAVLDHFGVNCETERNAVRVAGGQRPDAKEYTVPGDFSSAAFMLSAGAVAAHGSKVLVKDLKDRIQADAKVVGILRAFGAKVLTKGMDIEVTRTGELAGAEIDLNDSPDLFPVLCIVAAKAHGTSVLKGAGHLRFKESDRIDAMHRLLDAVGVPSEPLEDGIEIQGTGWIRGGAIQHFEDHRIAMAGAVAGIASEDGVVIPGAEVCGKSYPDFFEDLKRIGARVEVER